MLRKYSLFIIGLSVILPNFLSATELSPDVPLELKKPAYPVPWKRYASWQQTDWKDYNTLANEQISPAVAAAQELPTVTQRNPENGKKLVADRKRGGSCLACHILPDGELPGNVGIDLSTIGISGRSDARLFNYIYDPRQFNPKTVMPPWGTHQLFKPEEILDIVAYLQTLKTPTKFAIKEEDPGQRPRPTEDRDNLDPFVNPAMANIERGETLFTHVGETQKSCQSCHAKPVELFKTWATAMPKFSTQLNKVIGIEEFITRHALATTGGNYPLQSGDNLALATYLRYLANGQPIAIDAKDANTKAALERGEALTTRKIGQLNFACADCHVLHAGQWIRGQFLASMTQMTDHFPVYRTSRDEVWDLHKRFQWCGVAIRANELVPSAPEYGDLEMYLTFLNNKSTLSVPGIRH